MRTGHLAAAPIGRRRAILGEAELRHDIDDRLIERQQAALVEDHRHGSGGDCLGDRSQVENGGGRHRRRVGSVGKATDAAPRRQLSAINHGERRAGKDALLDGLLEQGKGTGEDAVLFRKRLRRNQAVQWLAISLRPV